MRRWILAAMAFAGLLAGAAPAPAADQSEPAFACTHKTWGFLTFNDGRFGTLNSCDYPVTIWFLRRGQGVLEATIDPGQYFPTDLTVDNFRDADWSAAICRAGRVPDVPVTEDQWDAILYDRYRCVRR